MVLITDRENHSHEILGLLKFTNYSVQVLARTQVGDGVASAPIYVQTRNDCTSNEHLLTYTVVVLPGTGRLVRLQPHIMAVVL